MTITIPDFGTLSPEVASAVELAEKDESSNVPKVVSKAFYYEVQSEYSNLEVTQILLIPAGVNSKGKSVRPCIVTRKVSRFSPRAQWNFTNLQIPDTTERADSTREVATNFLTRTLYWAGSNKKLGAGRPIVFEMLDTDYDDLLDYKAPASALRRIQKARVALGLPEKLYH
jgi:hypothetical protein